MNLPNQLTILRVILIPVCLLLWALGLPWWAAAVFALAAVTDFLDGYIARKRGIVTVFGKFADPVADKLLVLTTLVMLVRGGLMEAWVTVVILCRELAVDGLRMVAVGQGKVIAAGPWGKWKTTFQMITVIVILLTDQPCFGTWYTAVLTGISAALTVWSAVDYFVKNRSVFSVK